jgi:hypothetical protein
VETRQLGFPSRRRLSARAAPPSRGPASRASDRLVSPAPEGAHGWSAAAPCRPDAHVPDVAHARIRTGDLFLTKWSLDPGEFGPILSDRGILYPDHLPEAGSRGPVDGHWARNRSGANGPPLTALGFEFCAVGTSLRRFALDQDLKAFEFAIGFAVQESELGHSTQQANTFRPMRLRLQQKSRATLLG